MVGTLGGLYGHTLLRVEFSRLAPKQRVRAWVRLLALTAATGEGWRAVTLGRGARYGLARAAAGPVDPALALRTLADLVDLYRDGLRAPLPLPPLGAHTYARVRGGGASADEAVQEAMRDWKIEQGDGAIVRVWGAPAPWERITAIAGPPGGEPTLFGSLAMRLWEPLRSTEELVRR